MTTDHLCELIRNELRRLDWLCTDANPAACVVSAPPLAPRGWVRIADDYSETHGSAVEILAALKVAAREDVELNAAGLSKFPDCSPTNSRNWPDELISFEQLEDGTVNDNPVTLITVQTNSGTRYACGPHGVANCALSDAFDCDAIYDNREAAIMAGKC
jgi:hypothetical protein